jgi:drug/metabolite transporter (DMT)-like permease
MALVCLRTLRGLTRLEIWEGVGLGLFASVGLIFQMDGLIYTSASTSAFLTQFYCLTIPVWVACREGRWPSGRTVAGCLMVIAGVSVLSEFDWRQMRLGRGECETLIGSIIFTGQILWLQRPRFARNQVNHFTLVMFAVITVVAVPVAWVTGSAEDHWVQAWASGPALGSVLILTGFCTLGAYLLMNHWQPSLSATQAGLIYCLEPVFLPGWFSGWFGIQYANEQIGWSLLAGGGLITVANVLVQTAPPATTPAPERGAATAGP